MKSRTLGTMKGELKRWKNLSSSPSTYCKVQSHEYQLRDTLENMHAQLGNIPTDAELCSGH
jgi:hypothetical protein